MLIILRNHKIKPWRWCVIFAGIACLAFARLAFGGTCEGDKIAMPDATTLSAIQSSAMAGDAHAQAVMGAVNFRGKGAALDTGKALSWLEKSAAGGSSEGQYLLGEYYVLNGKSEEDFQKGASLLQKSTDQGCLPALFYLGLITENGKGVTKNTENGYRMILKAAEAGYAQAQWWLSTALIAGKGATKDIKAGFIWAKRAADAGDSVAQILLATLYLEGTGTQSNPEATRNLLESVYAKNDEQAPTAAYYLGWIYMEGKGVPVDTVKAFTWMVVASNSNIFDSVQRLKTLTEQLPKQTLVSECSVYMDPLFASNGTKEYAHANSGERVAVLSTRSTSEMVYFPDRKFVGFILRQCLN